jgi:hypothetical protein
MAFRTDTGSRAMKGNLYRLEGLCSYPTLTVETVSTRGPIQVQCGGRIEVMAWHAALTPAVAVVP